MWLSMYTYSVWHHFVQFSAGYLQDSRRDQIPPEITRLIAKIPRSGGDFCTGLNASFQLRILKSFNLQLIKAKNSSELLFNIVLFYKFQVIKSLTDEDDIILNDVSEKTIKLSDVTKGITNFYGQAAHGVYSTTRETLLGNMCSFLSDTVQETIVTMASKACQVSSARLDTEKKLLRKMRAI